MTQQPQINRGTAVITGASTGIGALYAGRLARMGYDLIIVARDHNRLNQFAKHLTNDSGRNVEVISADLTNSIQLGALEEKIRQDASITLLVNNAGIGTHSPLLQSNPDKMSEMITLNVTALTRLTYAVAPGMVERGHGAIINIASIVGIAPELLNGVYGGTKAFVLAFSQSLHHELANKGIQIQVVLPGATATPFWEKGGLPLNKLDPKIVMSAQQLVDAALNGFIRGEFICIPSLHDATLWETYELARQAMLPNLGSDTPAERYKSTILH